MLFQRATARWLQARPRKRCGVIDEGTQHTRHPRYAFEKAYYVSRRTRRDDLGHFVASRPSNGAFDQRTLPPDQAGQARYPAGSLPWPMKGTGHASAHLPGYLGAQRDPYPQAPSELPCPDRATQETKSAYSTGSAMWSGTNTGNRSPARA